MKATLLRWMIGVSIVDVLIGAVALTVFLREGAPAEAFRNAAVLIGFGLAGTICFAFLLYRVQRLPTRP